MISFGPAPPRHAIEHSEVVIASPFSMPRNDEELRAENAKLKHLLEEVKRRRMPFDLVALEETAADARRRKATLALALSRARELLRAVRLLVGQIEDLVHSLEEKLPS